jgi:hypothetical protein
MANETGNGRYPSPAERAAQATTQQVMQSGARDIDPRALQFDFDTAKSTTATVQQSNANGKSTKNSDIPADELPINNAKDLDLEDTIKRHNANQKSSPRSSLRERWEDLKARTTKITQKTTERIAEFKEEHPHAYKGISTGARLIAKGNVYLRGISYGYDGYKTTKEFIEFAKEIREKELLRHGNNAKPFHEIETALKNKVLEKLEKEVTFWKSYGEKTEYSHNSGFETQYKRQEKIDSIYQKMRMITHEPLSLEAKLSKKTTPEITEKFIQNSTLKAAEYEKQLMKGSAEEKYHWMLQQVKKELGNDYFNTSTHPQRSLLFDRFAAEHLRVSGFHESEVHKAIEKGMSCSVLTEKIEFKYGQKLIEREFLPDSTEKLQVMERTSGVQSKNIEEIKIKNLQFQKEKQSTLNGAKITPEEYTTFQKSQSHGNKYEQSTNNNTISQQKPGATQTSKNYHDTSNSGQQPIAPSKQQEQEIEH